MTLSEKVSQLKADFDEVYEVGAKDFGNYTSTVGENIAVCSDVHSKSHTVDISLSSDEITSFSDVTVHTYGKNWLDLSSPLGNGVKSTERTETSIKVYANRAFVYGERFKIYLPEGKTFNLSGQYSHGGNVSYAYISIGDTVNALSADGTFNYTIKGADSYVTIEFARMDTGAAASDTNGWCMFSNVIIRINTDDEVYEKFSGEVLTPSQSGTVNAKSISSKMYIVPDCECRVTAKYFTGKLSASTLYDEFWDSYQNNGKAQSCVYMFAGPGWNDKTFKPKYDIKPTGYSPGIFYSATSIGDLVQLMADAGITFDFSVQDLQLNSMFQNCLSITHIPHIDLSTCTNCDAIFYGCKKLVTIDEVTFSSTNTKYTTMFSGCKELVNCIASGTIEKTLDLSACVVLNKVSITSFINTLSETAEGQTLTLSKIAVNTAFGIDVDDTSTYPEGSEYFTLINAKSNWTVAYK